jgi:hypothetical protein
LQQWKKRAAQPVPSRKGWFYNASFKRCGGPNLNHSTQESEYLECFFREVFSLSNYLMPTNNQKQPLKESRRKEGSRMGDDRLLAGWEVNGEPPEDGGHETTPESQLAVVG